MGLTSCLSSGTPIVIDTSVAINLAASGIGGAVLRSIPCQAFVVKNVVDEVAQGALTGGVDLAQLMEWQSHALLSQISMDEKSSRVFESLVIGRAAETLDDGEAATIAVAVTNRFMPVVDERKANRICRDRFPNQERATTVDLFSHDRVRSALGAESLATGVARALMKARMRVLPQHLEWIVRLIGAERAVLCHSLPLSLRNALQRPRN